MKTHSWRFKVMWRRSHHCKDILTGRGDTTSLAKWRCLCEQRQSQRRRHRPLPGGLWGVHPHCEAPCGGQPNRRQSGNFWGTLCWTDWVWWFIKGKSVSDWETQRNPNTISGQEPSVHSGGTWQSSCGWNPPWAGRYRGQHLNKLTCHLGRFLHVL